MQDRQLIHMYIYVLCRLYNLFLYYMAWKFKKECTSRQYNFNFFFILYIIYKLNCPTDQKKKIYKIPFYRTDKTFAYCIRGECTPNDYDECTRRTKLNGECIVAKCCATKNHIPVLL